VSRFPAPACVNLLVDCEESALVYTGDDRVPSRPPPPSPTPTRLGETTVRTASARTSAGRFHLPCWYCRVRRSPTAAADPIPTVASIRLCYL
jgi:hypothetical protein